LNQPATLFFIREYFVEYEKKKENASRGYVENLLCFYSFKNLSKFFKKNVFLIYPFENQPWEKMLVMAFKRFNKIAFQHSTMPPDWLDYKMSIYEEDAPVPENILTTGKVWSECLRNGFPKSNIKEVGALRFSYLFDRTLKKNSNDSRKNITVLLAISTSLSVSLQRQLLKILNIMDLSRYGIRVKAHPYLPKTAILKKDFSSFENCRFTDENVDKMLADSQLVITSSSTVAFEAVFLGVKDLYFIPEEPFFYGLEERIQKQVFVAYEDNFLKQMTKALASKIKPNMAIEEYFSFPDYNMFLNFLEKKDLCQIEG